MARFAKIDGNGALLGFYDTSLGAAPAGAVPLTDEQYAQWLAAPASLVWSSTTSSLTAAAPSTGPAPVPTRVSRYQFKAQLLTQPGEEAGKTLLDDVGAWAAGQGGTTMLAWTDLAIVTRNSAFITAAAARFGWSSAQLDRIFTAAAEIGS